MTKQEYIESYLRKEISKMDLSKALSTKDGIISVDISLELSEEIMNDNYEALKMMNELKNSGAARINLNDPINSEGLEDLAKIYEEYKDSGITHINLKDHLSSERIEELYKTLEELANKNKK